MQGVPVGVFTFSLLGRLEARGNGPALELHGRKARELLCFLLLSRDRPQPREALAEMLWGDAPGGQSRKYLRQAVWQLQTALEAAAPGVGGTLLHAEQEWIQIRRSDSDVWLDVAELDSAYASLPSLPHGSWDEDTAHQLEDAVKLYRGDLLEGWYVDWCVFERERYRTIYLTILERLISHCETMHRWEEGIQHALLALQREPAHERTHRRLMRLLYLSGDRTAALRQYDRCAASLRSELGVEPGEATRALHEDVRADRIPRLEERPLTIASGTVARDDPNALRRKPSVLRSLHEVRKALDHARSVVERDIASLERQSRPLS